MRISWNSTLVVMRGAFDDVPVTARAPSFLTAADVESLRQVAGTVDTAGAARARPTGSGPWNTPSSRARGRARRWSSGLDVVQHAGGGDQLEFLLQVVWIAPGRLAIDAAVDVACWCENNHATHDVDTLRLVVGEETSLPELFSPAQYV